MIPVNQRVIDSETGDCFDACMVSILELVDFPELDDSPSQFMRWNNYLKDSNMHVIHYSIGGFPPPSGYAVLSVRSALFEGGRHAVVFKGDGWHGKIIHNPNPQDKRGVDIPNKDWLGFTVVCLVDPSILN